MKLCAPKSARTQSPKALSVMKNILLILTALVLLYSCSEDNELSSDTDWEKELIGVGYIGENPDSLYSLFSYYPCENNQPELLNNLFRYQPKINGDTIIFPNFVLYDLFRNMETDERISKDSSLFIISSYKRLYKFSKIDGHDFIPKTIYFNKYSNKYPKAFKYQAFSGFDRWDHFDIEINGKDSIKVWLKGSPYNPYLFEQKNKTKIDELFIGSYLNLVCENRYDTITFPLQGAIFCGTSIGETLVYNDSTFKYSTYFRRSPGGGILVNYFRSKLNNKVHSREEFELDMRSPIKHMEFNELPVAVENWDILAPPPPSE